jgi:hypothetical protein
VSPAQLRILLIKAGRQRNIAVWVDRLHALFRAEQLRRDCCVVRSRAGEIVDPGWSDRLDQLVEGSHHPQCRGLFDTEFVVAAAEVLHERVPGADHPRAAELFETAHRP